MHLNKKNAQIVKDALESWKNKGLIKDEEYNKLSNTINIVSFNFKSLAKWFFIFAIISFLISASGLLSILEILNNNPTRLILGITLTGIFYYAGFGFIDNKKKLSKEALVLIGTFSAAWAIAEFGILMSTGSNDPTPLFFIASIIYLTIAWFGKSTLVWLFALLSLGSWFGAQTGYFRGGYYLGIQDPLTFAVFGCVVIGAAFAIENVEKFKLFFKTTLGTGLLYLFISLWILSIWGHYDKYSGSNLELFMWSLLFAATSIISIYIGYKKDITMMRGYGITFLLINMYTKYCEYFWDKIHMSVFFLIFGLSLFIIAKKAESIWLITEGKFGKIKD